MDSESLQNLLLERIKLYEERIAALDSSLKEKDIEITPFNMQFSIWRKKWTLSRPNTPNIFQFRNRALESRNDN